MRELADVLGDVRSDGRFHSLKTFVKPNSYPVNLVASILGRSEKPIVSAWKWVDRVVDYAVESYEFWAYPYETLIAGKGDCDDSAILLCSVLRNWIGPERVFVVVGDYIPASPESGHAWVDLDGMILESTRSPNGVPPTMYRPVIYFNDKKIYSVNGWPGFIPLMLREHYFVGVEINGNR